MFIRKAERRQSKLRLALTGVSGSGKTMSALKVAKGMGGRIVCIDTESGSADLYSHVVDFDVLPLSQPFTAERYIEAIRMCERAGYDIIIIDSLSHAWNGSGGILEQVSKATDSSQSKNAYYAWNKPTLSHNNLFLSIVQSKCHMICCIRSKAHYEVMRDKYDKMVPTKVGLAPIQRDGSEHEFTIVFDIDKETHRYNVSKDRSQNRDQTPLFEGTSEVITEETGAKLIKWLNDGTPRETIMADYYKKIDSCGTMDSLKTLWFSIMSDNLLHDEIEKLTIMKDARKEFLNPTKDINMEPKEIQ